MGLRETINKRPAVTVAGAVVLIVAIGAEAYHFLAPPRLPPDFYQKAPSIAFYTTDGGATLFGDVDTNVPPFDYHGKPAVRAYVYACNGKQFVQCLEKYSDGPGSGLVVKRPGGGTWVADSDPQAKAIREPKCPDGGTPVPAHPIEN